MVGQIYCPMPTSFSHLLTFFRYLQASVNGHEHNHNPHGIHWHVPLFTINGNVHWNSFIQRRWPFVFKESCLQHSINTVKTGTLALVFSTLEYGGAVHVTILALAYYCVMKLTSTEFSVTLAGINIFTTTLGVQYHPGKGAVAGASQIFSGSTFL